MLPQGAMYVVEDVSKRLDVLIYEFCAIWEHPPIFRECRQILRPTQFRNLAV